MAKYSISIDAPIGYKPQFKRQLLDIIYDENYRKYFVDAEPNVAEQFEAGDKLLDLTILEKISQGKYLCICKHGKRCILTRTKLVHRFRLRCGCRLKEKIEPLSDWIKHGYKRKRKAKKMEKKRG